MGSFIATNLVLDFPNRVISCVLNAGIATTQEEFLRTEGFSAQPFAASTEELKQGKGVPTLARWLGVDGSPMAAMSEAQMANFNKMMLKGQDEIALSYCLSAFPQLFDINAKKRSTNQIPILGMAGDLDKWQQFVIQFTKEFSNLTFKPLPGVDHGLFGNKDADETMLSFINQF